MRLTVATAAIAVAVCSALPAFTAPAAEQATPMYMGNAARIGNAAEPLQLPLALKWKYSAQDGEETKTLVASPVASGDTVYFFTGKQMHAVSTKTGAAKWDEPLELPAEVDSTPVIADDMAVFGCRNGNLYFVRLGEAKPRIIGEFKTSAQHKEFKELLQQLRERAEIEEETTETDVKSSPLYHDGRIFFGASDGWVYALDLATQTRVWDFRTEGPIVASPAYAAGGVYVASTDGAVYGLSEDDGELVWKTDLGSKNLLASPVITHSKVISAAGRYLYTMDHGRPGYVRGRFEAEGFIVGTPAICGDTIIFGDTLQKLYAVDIGLTGNVVYTETESEYLLWQRPLTSREVALAPKERVPTAGYWQNVRSAPVAARIETGRSSRAGLRVGPAETAEAPPNAVIVRCGPRQLNAVNAADGSIVWHSTLSQLTARAARETPAPGSTSDSRRDQLAGTTTGARSLRRDDRGLRQIGMGMTGMAGMTLSRPTERSLEFEEEVAPSPCVYKGDMYVLGEDQALYAFSAGAADAVGPELVEAHVQVPATNDGRHEEELTVYDSPEDIEPGSEDPTKIRGALPIYIRVKAWDQGSGIDAQTLKVKHQTGPTSNRVNWQPEYDAEGPYLWAVCERYKGSTSQNLDDGEYVLSFTVKDWYGNEGTASVTFAVDNSMSPPAGAPTERGMPGGEEGMPRGMPGSGGMPMGMPGSGGMPMGMPGMSRGGGGGGGMPGMPGM